MNQAVVDKEVDVFCDGVLLDSPVKPLPITAILPCRDNRVELESHVTSMLEWTPNVAQVVVVDSSTDGSMEFLRDKLAAPNVEFHMVPPGLYQAWNFGVSRATEEFCYFSTVGDSISRGGLQYLCQVASKNSLDLVISPPKMIGINKESADVRWPIHTFADTLDVELRIPDRGEIIRWLTAFLPFTVLGSSASNLYSTNLLRKYPFPFEFGHGGDAALGVRLAAFAKIGITRQVFSTFNVHGPERDISAAEQAEIAKKFLALLGEVYKISPPEGLNSLAMSRALLENKIKVLEWIANLEPLGEKIKEQNSYIEFLETQKATLLQERATLSELSAGLPLPFLKSRQLLSLRKILRRVFTKH